VLETRLEGGWVVLDAGPVEPFVVLYSKSRGHVPGADGGGSWLAGRPWPVLARLGQFDAAILHRSGTTRQRAGGGRPVAGARMGSGADASRTDRARDALIALTDVVQQGQGRLQTSMPRPAVRARRAAETRSADADGLFRCRGHGTEAQERQERQESCIHVKRQRDGLGRLLSKCRSWPKAVQMGARLCPEQAQGRRAGAAFDVSQAWERHTADGTLQDACWIGEQDEKVEIAHAVH
jgi:hypothetical protein